MLLIYIIAIVWIIRIICNLLTYTALWYVKEYRFDRMIIHLHTREGKNILFPRFRKPPFGPRALFVFTGSCIIVGGFVSMVTPSFLIRLLIVDLLSFPISAFMVFLSKIPIYLYHEYLIRKATNILRSHKKMLVIGITGSYGKTSTKEVLYTILSQKYRTLKTEASKNSPIAIAETVIQRLRPEHEVFVVEMGAYKRGEIERMCSIVRPEIGVVTAINAQHQDLFGSIETTMKAKYELIRGLSGKRVALFNADNEFTRTMSGWARKDGVSVRLYTTKKSAQSVQAEYRADQITSSERGLKFIYHFGKTSTQIVATLYGLHQASNVLAALAVAIESGMTLDEAARACRLIHPFDKTMTPIKGINRSLFIDDTFNNNPDAAKAAIDFLSTRKGKKFLVFQPMIELGSYAQESHREIGAYAGNTCDSIILTNANYNKSFMAGARSSNRQMKVAVMSSVDTAKYIESTVSSGDTVLFKGREAAKALRLSLK
ncbi:MAG TPA: UDP-N-acetylmuramoyl-tripeptide--D-alanyl-D-alanine ligase [Patescibacteria group bacterium]|nr:UDP-N-acetylmuramoyl-tripeptide--D-alanyl-D-alanine ligase [Patescibacteria group bacterium]